MLVPVAWIEESRQIAAIPIALAGCCSIGGMAGSSTMAQPVGASLELGQHLNIDTP